MEYVAGIHGRLSLKQHDVNLCLQYGQLNFLGLITLTLNVVTSNTIRIEQQLHEKLLTIMTLPMSKISHSKGLEA